MQEQDIEKMSKKLESMLDPQIRPSGVRGPRLLDDEERRTRADRDFGKKSETNYSLDGLAMAFLVPMLVLCIIFAERGIFPFGENSFLRTDMYHQYAPFFADFKQKLSTGGSLFYSWNMGMGVNFSALYAYYLASPLNWLIVLCPKSLIIEFMTGMIVLKTGLSGLSFAWYLKKHCKSENFGVAFFGIFYALSGYMAAYSWNIMWLDCILLFPLIMLGLEKLVSEKKGMLYCVTLGISILSNYYISIMICIFMVVYFIGLLIMENKMSGKKFLTAVGQFTGYSLLAGGLAAVVLIPEIFALRMTASGDFSFPNTFTSYFSIFDMIARHIANVQTEIGLDHWPNIYCGTAVLMFFVMYLTCRHIKVKEKAVYCALLLFFFASFSMNIPNFIWHGFHYPNSLPCRQSFIYIFLMLVVCFRAYQHLKEIPWSQVGMAFLGAVAFVVMAEKLVEQEHFHFIVYYVAILYLSLYAGLIYLYKRTKMKRHWIAFLALVVVSIESAVNMAVTSITTTSRTSYVRNDKDIAAVMKEVMPSDDFFRVEKVNRKSKNDGAWEHFPSVSLFSSVANADLTEFFKKMGCEGSTNAYSITGSTPFVDMLLGVRYGLYEDIPEAPWKREVAASGDISLYENKYTLPLGFAVPLDFDSRWNMSSRNPGAVQNDFASVFGADRVLDDVYGNKVGGEYHIKVEEEGEYYAYITNRKIDNMTAIVGDNTFSFENVKRGYLLELGYCYENTDIMLSTPDSDLDVSAYVYRVNEKGLQQVYSTLSKEGWHLTEWRDAYLAGKIETEEDRLLFTTIPYDKGWTVKVDGNKVETRKVADTFLGIEVPTGKHEITMKYVPEGFLLGVWITTGSLIVLLIFALVGKMMSDEKRNLEEEEMAESKMKIGGRAVKFRMVRKTKMNPAKFNTEQSNTEQFNAEQSNAKKSNTEQSNTDQFNTDQSNTEQSNTEKSNTGQSNTEKSNTEQSNTAMSNIGEAGTKKEDNWKNITEKPETVWEQQAQNLREEVLEIEDLDDEETGN